jgi:polysaccharide export outer membrane protein
MPMKLMRFFSLVFIAVAALVMTGCAGSDKIEGKLDQYAAENEHRQQVFELNQTLFATGNLNSDPGDLLLGHGDLIQVTVFEAEELKAQVRVTSRGFITLPLLGHIEVKGLTAREAEVKIEDLYRSRYIKNPHVSIFVRENFSQRISVVGEVRQSGTYDYTSRQRLVDVLALAGGLTENAGSMAQIRRSSSSPGSRAVVLVDLDRLIKAGIADLNIEINPGDVIYVPEAGVFFVDGAVRKPGPYPVRNGIVLTEALHTAGGLASWADDDKVLLVRTNPEGKQVVTEIDLNDPESHQIKMQDRDVVIAKGSAFGKLWSGTNFSFGIPGIMGFGYRDPER